MATPSATSNERELLLQNLILDLAANVSAAELRGDHLLAHLLRLSAAEAQELMLPKPEVNSLAN